MSKQPLALNILIPSLILTLPAMVHSQDDFDHSHAALNQILATHVDDEGLVDYDALSAAPEQLLSYLGELAFVSKGQFDDWSEPQQLAFLINAYNAETLQLIVDHYPIKSIKQIGGLFGDPWELPAVNLFGETMSLNHLENGIIRANYPDEPRVHFALVCAALGCPPLRNEAFTAAALDTQLDEQARQFLGTPFKNYVSEKNGSLYLSPIFDWYGSDFGSTEADLIAALKPYLPAEAAANLADDPKIASYTFYDWELNKAESVIPEKAVGGLQKMLLRTLQEIDYLGPIREVAYVLCYIVCAVFLISALLLTLAGGFLFGPFWGVVWVSLASNLGSAAAFLIGRYVARGPIERKFAKSPKFKAIDGAVEESGWKIVLLTRLTPVLPYIALNYIFGLTKVRFWPYMAVSWIGMLPGTIAYVWIGSLANNLTALSAGGGKSNWSTTALLVVGIIAALGVSIYITKIAKKALAAHVSEPEST